VAPVPPTAAAISATEARPPLQPPHAAQTDPHCGDHAERHDRCSFQPVMYDSLLQVQKDMGGESAMQTLYRQYVSRCRMPRRHRDYASKGFDMVIAHGSQYGSSVQDIAPDFPKVTFAWGTMSIHSACPTYTLTPPLPNKALCYGVLAAN